jgi:hypothetical protein
LCEISKRDQRAFLRHVRAKQFAQRLMDQVCGRMVGAQTGAACVVDLELDRSTGLQRALRHLAVVDEEPVRLLLRVGDLDREAVAGDGAGVAHLAARFAVERRLVDDDRDLLALPRLLDLDTVAHDGAHQALRLLGVVAEELGRAELLAQ